LEVHFRLEGILVFHDHFPLLYKSGVNLNGTFFYLDNSVYNLTDNRWKMVDWLVPVMEESLIEHNLLVVKEEGVQTEYDLLHDKFEGFARDSDDNNMTA